MLKPIVLSRKSALGLLAYVNQAELSLDRVPADNYNDLILYYSTKVRPQLQEIVARLRQIAGDEPFSSPSSSDWQVCRKRLSSTMYCMAYYIKSMPNWALKGIVLVPQTQMRMVYDALLMFSDIACGSLEPSQDERIDIRMKLAYSAGIISLRIPDKRLVAKARNVEHLNQAEHMEWRTINGIVGHDWMF